MPLSNQDIEKKAKAIAKRYIESEDTDNMMNTRSHNLRMSGLSRDDIKILRNKVYNILVTEYDALNSLGMSPSSLKNDVNSALDMLISHSQSMSRSRSSSRSNSRSSSRSNIRSSSNSRSNNSRGSRGSSRTSTSSSRSQQGGKTTKNRNSRKERRTRKNRKN